MRNRKVYMLILSIKYCLYRWVIEFSGAAGTFYEGENFQLQIEFPEKYPMDSPQVYNVYEQSKDSTYHHCFSILSIWRLVQQVIFVGNPPVHPHIYSNGHICLGKICI